MKQEQDILCIFWSSKGLLRLSATAITICFYNCHQEYYHQVEANKVNPLGAGIVSNNSPEPFQLKGSDK